MKPIVGAGWLILGIVLLLLPLFVEPQPFIAVLADLLIGSVMIFRYMCIHDWMS